MAKHVALLRAINVGGNSKVAMSDLRGLLEELGLADVRSLLQSGNLVFRSEVLKGAELEQLLEAEARKRLRLETSFLIRMAKEWDKIIAANPFREEAEHDPSHLLVMFLKDVPDAKAVKALRAAIKGREVVRTEGKQAYIVYPDGIGRSRLTNALIEARLATIGTGRNWNTVLKLAALAHS
jgi:uncharacterized protein (DUF1697 family)